MKPAEAAPVNVVRDVIGVHVEDSVPAGRRKSRQVLLILWTLCDDLSGCPLFPDLDRGSPLDASVVISLGVLLFPISMVVLL